MPHLKDEGKLSNMRQLFSILRKLAMITTLLAAGVVAYDYYKIKTTGLPYKITLWDKDYRSLKVELLAVNDSQIQFQRLHDGQHLSINPQELSFFSRSRIKFFGEPKLSGETVERPTPNTRLMQQRDDLRQRIEYLETSIELTTSETQKRTQNREIQRVREDLLEVEKRLKDSGVEIDYSSSGQGGSQFIQKMSSQLINQISK
jgi:hypothetical protein